MRTLILFLLFATFAAAQNTTTVSGTVKDANGVPYSNGTVQAQLLPAGVTPTVPPPCNGQAATPCVVSAFQRGSTDASGNFNMNLASNGALSPGGTQWQFTVNATGAPAPLGTGPQTCSATLTISGASQSVTSSFSACPALSNIIGGGGSPVGNNGDTQIKNGPIFGAGTCNDTGTSYNCSDFHTKGPSPFVDVTRFGARPFPVNSGAPGSPGITAACISGNPNIILTGSGFGLFQTLDGITLINCGTTHSMATPSAPAVQASIAVAPTSSGFVGANTTGATTRCYKIAAFNQQMGLTAASPETCISNGQAILGADPIAVTSCSRSVAVVTCVTSAHTLPVGCSAGTCGGINVAGTSDDLHFGGWYELASVPDTTHFTYNGSLSAAQGASTSATGGTFTYYNSDHLTLPAFTAGQWQYAIWEGASGAETLVDVSLPNGAFNAQVSANAWDYFGPTYGGNGSLPYFLPNTPPVSATNNALTTTIAGGGGTTSLALAQAPSNTISGQTALFDDCPTAGAANAFANNFTGGGGATVFPPAIGIPAVGLTYIFNSYCTFAGAIVQQEPILLNMTMQFNNVQWYGDVFPNSLFMSLPSFSDQGHVLITDGQAKPGIYMTGSSMEGVGITAIGNNYIALLHSNFGTSKFDDMTFVTNNSTDINGILFYDFPPNGQGFGWKMTNVEFLPGPGSSNATSWTPTLMSKFNGEMHIDWLQGGHRGFLFVPFSNGLTLDLNQRQESQGLTMSQVNLYCTGGGIGGYIHLRNFILDTAAQPLITNLAACNQMQVLIEGTNAPSTSIPLISGIPLTSVTISTQAGGMQNPSSTGQNVNMEMQGANAERYFNHHTALGPAYGIFSTTTGGFAAPTCTTATAGPPFTQAFTSSTFQYAPVYLNGGIGALSLPSNPCTADGVTQQVTVTIPAQLPGVEGYAFWKNSFQFGTVSANCAIPGTPTSVLNPIMNQNCGVSTPAGPTGGPAGFQDNALFGATLLLGLNLFSNLGTPINGTFVYCPDCTIANPCAGGGTGALAKRLNGIWVCN
jgi:hypothetical protein